jgi:hypothetical protein
LSFFPAQAISLLSIQSVFHSLSFFNASVYIPSIDLQAMTEPGETSIQPKPSGEATSQPKASKDVSNDEQDEALLKLNEDELRGNGLIRVSLFGHTN